VIRPLLLLSVCSLTAFSYSQTKVVIKLPAKKEIGIFEDKAWPTKEPQKLLKVNSDSTDFQLTGEKLFLIDYAKGNVAVKSAADLKSGTWDVKESDFTAVYKVVLEVSTPKGLATAASLDLSDASGKRSELLDSSSKGRASFLFVQPGEIKTTVTYRADGKMADPVKQSFTLKLDREATEPVFKVALPGGDALPSEAPAASAAATGANSEAKGPSAAEKKDKDEPEVSRGSNPLGNVLITLIGLAFVGGVAFYILKMMRENPDKVKDTMTKLGADLPKLPGDDPDPVAPIAPPVQQPMQQIILDGAVPEAIPAMPAAVVSPPAISTGIPILIATDGSEFPIPDGETVVGREFGNGLVVPNDTVSRRHASIQKSGTQVEVQDHGSTNGTWVNGVKVIGTQALRPGDSVRFGSIEYRYQG
jgi:hypothetical protein